MEVTVAPSNTKKKKSSSKMMNDLLIKIMVQMKRQQNIDEITL